MHDHSADILGNEHLRTSRPPPSRFTPQWLAVYAVCLAVLYIVGHTAWRRVLHWRERSSKLAMRRRYGIPDSDMRPFNVAYAEAMNKRSDEEKRRSRPNPARPAALPPQREAELEQSLRHRAGLSSIPDARGHTPNNTARSNSSTYNNVPVNSSKTYLEDYNPGHPGQFTHEPTTSKGLARSRGYLNVQDANATFEDGKKRAFDEDMAVDGGHEAKKSRVDAVALEPTENASSLQRGEKRGLGDDEDENITSFGDSRGKRARQASQHLQRQDGDQSMEIDSVLEAQEDEDEVTELRSPVRGKKRDRAEAGSTFGGDDDDEQIQAEDEKDRRRRRKRRTVAKRVSEASFARGKKRDAEDEEEEVSEEEGSGSPERHRRKSKRQTLRDSRSMNSDISMSDSTRSKVREIGEEWESNGVKYKIGPNYDKLRQALVKKARQKFIMPQDSQHPDRDTNLEVYVECWLTEEEYAEAKKQHRLAWQDSPAKETPEKLTVKTVHAPTHPHPAPPQPTGKTLLWSAPTSTNSTPVGSPASSVEPPDFYGRQGRRRDPFRESIVNQPLSPFIVPGNLPTARRVASNSQPNYAMFASTSRPPVSPGANGVTSFPSSPVVGESALGSPRYRTYSKWEKQELEANAMMRVRAANAKKEEEARRAKEEQERQLRERLEREKAEKEQREQKEKAEKEKKDKEAAAAATSAIPTITVTPASTSGSAPASGFSFGPSAATGGASSSAAPKNLFAPTPSASSSAAPATSSAAPATEPPKFSFGPSTPAPAPVDVVPKPTNTFSFANAAPLGGDGGSAAEPAKGGGSAGAYSGPFSVRVANSSNLLGKSSTNVLATAPANLATPAPPAVSASESTAPNFSFSSFGTMNKTTSAPAAGSSAFGTPATNASSSALNGALGGTSESKPSGSTFLFKMPGAPASATANAGGTSTASNLPAVNPTAPKFSFGTTSTSNSAPSPFGNPSASSTEPAKDTTATPKFSFNTATTSTPSAFGNNATSTTSAATEPAKDAPTKPAFNFGTSTTTSNPFGGNTTSANPNPFGGSTSSTNPSPFGGSGSTTSVFGKPAGGATSAFGTTGSNTSGSVFGSTSNAGASNPFGAAKNTFGSAPSAGTSAFGATAANNTATSTSSADKPAEAAKPMFSFTPAATATPAAAASSAPTSTFSFGSTSSATPAAGASSGPAASAAAPSPFSFNFGGATSGAAAPKPSPFGAAAGTNAFGSTGTGAFSFGNPTSK